MNQREKLEVASLLKELEQSRYNDPVKCRALCERVGMVLNAVEKYRDDLRLIQRTAKGSLYG